MRTLAAALVLLGAGSAAAQAPPVAPTTAPTTRDVLAGAPTAASVTIYRDRSVDAASLDELSPEQGLALISETRTVDIAAAGRVKIAFRGVADTIVPQTVALTGLPGAVIERNEDFDLLTPGSLVAHSLGRQVRVIQTGSRKGAPVERTAVIRSAPVGIVLDFGGQLEALGCGGPPTRLVFDRAPAELSDKPTFSVVADAPKPGRYTVRLSYLATGFSWSADYVAHIRPDGKTLDLQGWLTLANKTAAGFDQAPTDVVAGDLERDDDTRPVSPSITSLRSICWGQSPVIPPLPIAAVERRMMAPAPPGAQVEELVTTAAFAKQSDLGDYKLYTLPEPTQVAAHQTKQVAFLGERDVPFERIYVSRFEAYDTRGDEDPVPAEVVLRLKNRTDSGLGKPLPAGTVSVMETASGAPALAGEQKIDDVAVGLPLELHLGRAMDVAVLPRVTAITRKDHVQHTSVAVSFENDKPEPIVLEHRQYAGAQDFHLDSASAPSVLDKGDRVWIFHLAPGQKAQLTYVMSERD